MKNVYSIDFFKLMIDLSLISDRKPKIMALFRIIATQIQKIHYEFIEYKNDLDQGVKTQNCYLRGELNKWFDPYQKRIFLRTITPNYDDYLIHSQSSGKFTMISKETPFMAQSSNSLLANHTSFEVVLPTGFVLNETQDRLMRSILDKNKLPSKTYRITNG